MRIKQSLVLLTMSVCSVAAFTASTSKAASVRSEATGVACSAIAENDAPATPEVSGGCPIAATATDFEVGGAFGVMLTCDMTLEGKINGSGAMNGVWAINSATGGCETNSATPCTGAADAHSSNSALTGAGPTSWITFANICIVGFGLTNRCVGVTATFHENVHDHSLSFAHPNKCANGVNSLQGTFVMVTDASHPKFEVS